MSWLNDELPTDWPTKPASGHLNHNDTNFSTSQSSGEDNSVEFRPTVAIQPNTNEATPPWKRAIHAPGKRPSFEQEPGLTGMFRPVQELVNNGQKTPQIAKRASRVQIRMPTSDDQHSERSGFSTESSSHSEENEESIQQPVNRKLNIFGTPNTYTHEKLGNLLSSMAGNSGEDEDSISNTRNTFNSTRMNTNANSGTNGAANGSHNNGTTNGNTKYTSRSEFNTNGGFDNASFNGSDAGFLDGMNNEGRHVLQQLARPAPLQESSLDELEQQLTSQSADKPALVNHLLDETTSSAIYDDSKNDIPKQMTGSPLSSASATPNNSSSSHTLDTLPPKLRRNWSTIKRNLGEAPPSSRLVNKDSAQTLLGSGRSSAKIPTDADISALGIHDVSNQNDIEEDQSYQHQHQHQLHRQHQDQSEYPYQPHVGTEPIIPQFTTPKNRQTRPVLNLPHEEPQRVISTSDSLGASSRGSVRIASTETAASAISAAERTPDSIVKQYLSFPRNSRRSRNSSGRVARNDILMQPGTPLRVDEEVPQDTSASNETNNGPVDCSVAQKDLSFSVGLEIMAHLIRERMPADVSRIEDLDSLDLNQCDLESVYGLSKFAPHLITLFLNDNSIRSLDGLPSKLVHLDMSSNELSNVNRFPDSMISTLLMSNNKLETLEPLSNLLALSSLDLSNNNLTSLKGIKSLTALRTLNVRQNNLKSIDLNLGMLVELDAAQNDLVSVRLATPNLETLDLAGNNIATLTDPLPNLRELNIQYNNATVDFAGFDNLKVLLFDGNAAMHNFNQISNILETFSWEQPKGAPNRKIDPLLLRSIRDIKLSGGKDMGWPFGLSRTEYAAQHLDLSALGIRELPLEFAAMFPFVKSVNLSFNKLDDRVISVLSQCRSLERLSLFGNRMGTVGDKLATQIPQLRVLDSRGQRSRRSFVATGEFPTEKYNAVVESALRSSSMPNVSVVMAPHPCKSLQFLDGRWTNHASETTITTRPGFPSPLYPAEWIPNMEMSPPNQDVSDMTSMRTFEPVDAIELIEAMYAQHFFAMNAATI